VGYQHVSVGTVVGGKSGGQSDDRRVHTIRHEMLF